MSDEKVVYLSKLLDSKPVDTCLPEDSLTLISAFMEIRSPEGRQAVIDFCEKLARSENSKSD
ncbi:MAG: hypothetical protein EOP20_09480 [Hyphomicrobiales bacterium]|jgi:hypothetical protein|nr:MAG: hypothetical protein EOP20_09480 [Hyphomicrobiales bacterium]